MLKALYVIAIFFIVLLILFTFDLIIIPKEKTPLLGAIGIILSAFIASFSVKASIDNTNKLEELKINRKIKNLNMIITMIIYKIDMVEFTLKDFKDLNDNTIHFMYKKNIFYLFGQAEYLVNNNFIELMENEKMYLILIEIINEINILNDILNLYDNHDFNDLEINNKLKSKIVKLKVNCSEVLKYYKGKI